MNKRSFFPASSSMPSTEATQASAPESPAAFDDLDNLAQETPRSTGGLFAEEATAPKEEGAPALDDETLTVLCRMRICPQCPVNKEAEDARLRALAEMDNTRKRLAREREEQIRFAAESVLADIIPSLDNLNLALHHATPDEACKDFVTGVRMTRDLLVEALKKHGLQPVGETGEVFDPARHEAVGTASSPDVPDGHICALFSQGYTLYNRLLRPARVMVCKKA